MSVPNIFANQIGPIPLSELDANFTSFQDTTDLLKGVALVGGAARVVSSITALRALPKAGSPQAFVSGYYAPGDEGGGFYYYDSSDTSSSDNGGTTIVATDGGRWKLVVQEQISVKQFGAVGDGVADDTFVIQSAVTYCLQNRRTMYVPSGVYKITSPIGINNTIAPNWPMFEIVGECSATPSAILQSGNIGSIFITSNNNAFEIAYSAFNNETIKFSKLSFRNVGTAHTGKAIQITKNSVSYPRKFFLDDVNFLNYSDCIHVIGGDASIFNNFFGTSSWNRVEIYDVACGIRLTDCYFNLLEISNSLIRSTTLGGLVLDTGAQALGGGGIFSISDTHFEGCEGAGIVTSGRATEINLHNVSSESCGVTSTKGAWDMASATTIRITGNANVPGTAEIPPKVTVNSKVYSTVPVTIRSDGCFVGTPDTVTLYTDANNSDSFAFFPLESISTPHRATSQFPYAPAAGGANTPANLATKYNFTADTTVYNQGVATNTIPSGVTAQYVYASFLTKNTPNQGFAAGSQYKLASFGPFALSTANCSSLTIPLVCVLCIHVPAFFDVNSLVLVNKTADYGSSTYVSIEPSLRTLASVGHPSN